jgi:hypothetical protein
VTRWVGEKNRKRCSPTHFCQNQCTFNLYRGKKIDQIFWLHTSVFFKKLPKINYSPIGEKSPNLWPILWFFNIFANIFCSNYCLFFCKNLIISFVFYKNAKIFRWKLSKIAENCDHNIGP